MEVLLCTEAQVASEGPIAQEDSTLLDDKRVLDNLISLQATTMPAQDYFTHIQTDIQPYMRKVVTTWMLEVCEEQCCEEQVFGVAVNFLDRFLCCCILQKSQLQLLGAVCLLLASKLRQCRPLSVELLSYYTDYSVTQEEIKKWELVLVSKLGWDLSPVTACDFLEYLLRLLPGAAGDQFVRRHSATFIALAVTDSSFIHIEPSCVAVGALIAAVRGLRSPHWVSYLHLLSSAINESLDALLSVAQLVEATVEKESALIPQATHQQQQPPLLPPMAGDSTPMLTTLPPLTPTHKTTQTLTPMDAFDGNETPTDVTDILF